jgi:uncharacterized protein (UPF0333 family)
MKKLISKKGQNAMEYIIIMSVVVAGILAIGFIGRMRGAFSTYFNKASSEITTNH